MIPVGARVRDSEDNHAESVRVGHGEVTKHNDDGTVAVMWDNGYYMSHAAPERLVEVTIAPCVYTPEKWGHVNGIAGPVLMCRTHKGAPAAHEAYEDLTTTVRCRGPW